MLLSAKREDSESLSPALSQRERGKTLAVLTAVDACERSRTIAPVRRDTAETDLQPAALPPSVAGWAVAQRSASVCDLDRALTALVKQRWIKPPTLAKREGMAETWLGALHGATGEIALKIRRVSAAPRSASHFARAWRGALRLQRAGIATGEPLAILREPAVGSVSQPHREALLLRAVPGSDLLHVLHNNQSSQARLLCVATRTGALVHAMAQANLRNRDAKLSNLILMTDWNIGVIDTAGVGRIVPLPLARARAVERMLFDMLKESSGCSVLPARTALWRCLTTAMGPAASRDARKALWRRLARALDRAGDTTPRVDPLG